jgi:hypothetical protein
MIGSKMNFTIERRAIPVGQASRRRKGKPYDPGALFSDPTPERMARAGRAFEVGGDVRTGKVIRIMDSPLDSMLRHRMVDGREYAALDKLRHHWWHANLSGSPRSADLNRAWATDTFGFSHMPKSEKEAHHRSQYRKAMNLFEHVRGIVVTNALFSELPLHLCMPMIGSASAYRCRERAKQELVGAASQLIKYWGI